MIQAFRFIEISKYGDGGQLTTRGQLMQGSSTIIETYLQYFITNTTNMSITENLQI